MFTNPEDRQSEELVRELTALPVGGDPSFGQKIRIVSHTEEAQRSLIRKYESRHPRSYQYPGEERHDA